jgi:PIN domain nuclease of toxin-antitoxin system
MKYLLDTSVWLWSVGPVVRIDERGRDLLADGKQELYFSAASAWKISIKMALGKLRLPEPPATYVPARLTQQGIRSLPILQRHALAVRELPIHHTDPFDRLLIAQAQLSAMTILTADSVFRKYNVTLLWCG